MLTRYGLSPSATFMVFSMACFAAYFWSTYVVPETAGVSLEEMDAVFGSTAGLEDLHLKRQVCIFPCSSSTHPQLANFLSSQIEQDLGLHDLVADITAGAGTLQTVD